MMWGRISKQEAILRMRTAVKDIKKSYLYGWTDDLFYEAIHCLADVTDRFTGADGVEQVFGSVRLKPKKGYVMKTDFTEIFKLKDMLDHEGIPNEYLNLDNEEAGVVGRQIIYPAEEGRVSDAALSYRAIKEDEDEEEVFNAMSLGAPLLEQMGLVDGTRYGIGAGRTAEQVFESWKKHYEENNGQDE